MSVTLTRNSVIKICTIVILNKINVGLPKKLYWVLTSGYTTNFHTHAYNFSMLRVIFKLMRVIFILMRVILTRYVELLYYHINLNCRQVGTCLRPF
jgi:hypothetical protein